MKFTWLILLSVFLFACNGAEATTLSDGRPGLIAHCNTSTETECLAYIGQACPNGFDVIKQEHGANPNDLTYLVYCREKFTK